MLEKQLEFDFMKQENNVDLINKDYLRGIEKGIEISNCSVTRWLLYTPVLSTLAFLGYSMIEDPKTTIGAMRSLYQAAITIFK